MTGVSRILCDVITNETYCAAIRDLHKQGLALRDIADVMELSPTTVAGYMDQMGLWRPKSDNTQWLMGENPVWMEDAVCARTDPEAFFPTAGMQAKAAKRICRGCPVALKCLDYALDHDERFGVWGGLSERERRQVRKDRVTELAHGSTP